MYDSVKASKVLRLQGNHIKAHHPLSGRVHAGKAVLLSTFLSCDEQPSRIDMLSRCPSVNDSIVLCCFFSLLLDIIIGSSNTPLSLHISADSMWLTCPSALHPHISEACLL
jgi:hypothetical protein